MSFSLVISHLNYEINGTEILSNISINLDGNSKYAIFGKNGAGKSTFLKILAGEITEFNGNIGGTGIKKIAYLPQNTIDIDNDITLFDLVHSYLRKMDNNYIYFEKHLPENLSLMGFSSNDYDKKMGSFSGGYKMRAFLAALLSMHPDILLLDEPESHLDEKLLAMLKNKLKKFKGLLLFVSHNIDFINGLSQKIIEIENTNVKIFNGGFEAYKLQKKNQMDLLLKKYHLQQRHIKKLKDFVQKNIARESSKNQATARQKKLDKIVRIEAPSNSKDITFEFDNVPKLPQILIKMEDVHLGYGSSTIINGGNFIVERGDKIGVYAPNGMGKTTLIKAINCDKSINTNETNIFINKMTEFAVFSQNFNSELEDITLKEFGQSISYENYRSILAKFLFTKDLHRKISMLSGGERARIKLLNLINQRANLLILDEPTNNLDIDTINVFINVLQGYPGSIILVSHNKEILDKTVDRVLLIRNKKLINYFGDFSYVYNKYLAITENKGEKSHKLSPKEIRKKKLFYREYLKKLETEIKILEKEIFDIELKLENEHNDSLLSKLKKRKRTLRNKLNLKTKFEEKFSEQKKSN
ncbi:ABC-F family ATP-binding cassette domain-containing protein [bacterium]|nr:ABC-F family ATP-binding cassette domain-containing protein [bacterium]